MTPLPDPLPIMPFRQPARGDVTVPGSKSITNRALLLAALCDAPVALTNVLFSEDTEIMARALNALGITVTAKPPIGAMLVTGHGGKIPAPTAELFVGNAGTAARFLTALCAAAPQGIYRLDGVPQMRQRPMKGLIDALRALGADIRCSDEEGLLPLEIHAHGLGGGVVSIDARASSQMLSALLMVAPLARSDLKITLAGDVREPYVRMTARMMEQFGRRPMLMPRGQPVVVTHGAHYALGSGSYRVEPDASAASYFLALPLAVGGRIRLPGLRRFGQGLQGDARFVEIVEKAGATIALMPNAGGVEAILKADAPRRGLAQEFREFSDTFLTLAAIAPLLEGPTRITGIGHTRRQETDRVAGAARELRKLGQEVIEEDDALTITPRPLTSGVAIETYDDHRFAMSFAILGCHDRNGDGRPWLSINNPSCCAKTFPEFFTVLETVRRESAGAVT